MNLTLQQKQALEGLVEDGKIVATVAYNPETVVGDPEADAIADGFEEWYREDTPTLVEVIYLK